MASPRSRYLWASLLHIVTARAYLARMSFYSPKVFLQEQPFRYLPLAVSLGYPSFEHLAATLQPPQLAPATITSPSIPASVSIYYYFFTIDAPLPAVAFCRPSPQTYSRNNVEPTLLAVAISGSSLNSRRTRKLTLNIEPRSSMTLHIGQPPAAPGWASPDQSPLLASACTADSFPGQHYPGPTVTMRDEVTALST